MWTRAVLGLLAMGCGGHPKPRADGPPQASPDMRCTLRIAQHRILVDGAPRSRADAVAYCKGMPGGAVVVIDDAPQSKWDKTTETMVRVEDTVTQAEWDLTRSALEREGVRFFIRGPLCYTPGRFDCRPIIPSAPTTRPPLLLRPSEKVAKPAP